MIIQILHVFITVTAPRFSNHIEKKMKIPRLNVEFLHIINVISYILGYSTNNYLIAIVGAKTGLLIAFGMAVSGGLLTLCLDKSYWLFLLGFILLHMFLPAFNYGKGIFTNTFFVE